MPALAYEEFSESWVGAGGPPIALGDDRFLMIYHLGNRDASGNREYDLAAALLDFRSDLVVENRIEPLMRPAGQFEQRGDADLGVDNVVFTCANFVWRDRVFFPYAGADSRILGCSVVLKDLVAALE